MEAPSSMNTTSPKKQLKPLPPWQELTPETRAPIALQNLKLWVIEKVTRIDGKPFSFENYQFLDEIYTIVQDYEEAVIQKCAQIGATVLAMLWMIYHVGIKKKNGIYYFPTDAAISSFVQARFNPMVSENEGISTLVDENGIDNVRTKKIGETFAYFLGLKGTTQKLSTPADVEVFDELDAAPGPKDVEIAEERLGASAQPKILWLSTPTFPGFGINKKFLTSDQRHYHMKCGHCGKWNYSPTGNEVPESDELKFPDCIENGFLACKHCGKELKHPMKSRWIQKYNRPIPGWQITKFMSPITRFDKLLKDFHDATNIQNFYNSKLGLPYADGENFISKDAILSMCGDYSMYPSLDSRYPCTAGIDVGRALHVVISRESTVPGKKREYVYIGECKGFGSEKFKELGRLLTRFNVKKFVIDGMPETSEVEDFLSSFKGKGFACFYSETPLLFTWKNPGFQEIKNNIPVIHHIGRVDVNRTESLDTSQKVLRDKEVVFPRLCSQMEAFADHCQAIAKTEVRNEKTGALSYTWIQNESEPDHYRHAFSYDVMCWDTKSLVTSTGKLVKSPGNTDKAGRRL